MKKWYIFLQMTNAVMIGSILAPIWIDEYYWFYMDLLHIIALLLFVIFFCIIGKKQTKEFERLSKEAIMTYDTLEFHSRLLPWISVDKDLPKEGEFVYIAFREKTGFGVNVATFENGVFNSYSTNKPDYWMHVPVLQKVEDEV